MSGTNFGGLTTITFILCTMWTLYYYVEAVGNDSN